MHLGAFVRETGQHVAAWLHPQAHFHSGVSSTDMVEVARTAERRKFDFLLLADTSAVSLSGTRCMRRDVPFSFERAQLGCRRLPFLPPTIGICHFRHGLARERAVLLCRKADWHQGEGPDMRRDAECCLHLVLVEHMVGGDHCTEPQRAAGKDDVLYRRVDAGTAGAPVGAVPLRCGGAPRRSGNWWHRRLRYDIRLDYRE